MANGVSSAVNINNLLRRKTDKKQITKRITLGPTVIHSSNNVIVLRSVQFHRQKWRRGVSQAPNVELNKKTRRLHKIECEAKNFGLIFTSPPERSDFLFGLSHLSASDYLGVV